MPKSASNVTIGYARTGANDSCCRIHSHHLTDFRSPPVITLDLRPIRHLMGGVSTFSVQRRRFAYVVLGLGLLGCSIPLGHLAWIGDPWIHTLLEAISTL